MKKVILAALVAVMIFPQIANAGSITGMVIRDLDGSLISGLWIWANDYETNEYYSGDHTDVNGVYLITGLDTGSYRVQVSGSGTQYASEFYDNQISWDSATPVNVVVGQQTTGIDFSLALGGSISGTVADSNGVPQENIEIHCWADGGYGTGDWTEPNGLYECGGLPVGFVYNVTAYPPPDSNYMITKIDVPVFEPNDYTGNDIVFTVGGLAVSGRVTDKQTSLPLENIRIGCWHDDADFWVETRTDANGIYALTNLPPGEVEVRAEPETYYVCIGSEFELQEDINDLDFALPPEATLSGKVLDAETAEPLAGIEVEYWNERYVVWQNDYTESNGTFTLTNLPPGITEIKAMPDVDTGYAWNLPWGSNWICLAEGEHRSGRIIALQKGALVRGCIKDSNNNPLSNVEYGWEGRMSEGWADTDINGHYEIRLPLGTYVIGLDEDEFGALHPKVTITDINQPVDINDIKAYSEQTGGQISGDVNNLGGHPKTGEFIIIALEAGTVIDPNTWYTVWPVSETELEQAGPFAITASPPDANYDVYLLVVSETPDGIESITLQDYLLDVAPGANDVNLYYSSEGGTLLGTVENTDDQIVLGATVLLSDPCTAAFAGFADVNENGEYVIYNVPAGTYTATAVHSKYLNASTTVEVIDTATTDASTIVMTFTGEKEGADLNGDGFVDMFDVAEFIDQWLESGSLEADFDQDGTVDFVDWARLAENWLWQAVWYHD